MLIRNVFMVAALSVTCAAQVAPASSRAYPTFQTLVQNAKSRIREMGPEQLKKLAATKEKYTLIDVREDNEWAAGHAAGAKHISRGVLEKGIETSVPQRNAKIILYCHSGARSALAADTLQSMGYSDVYSLAGGFAAYEKSGLPLEK
jgi:rhodanese-related sulfurtransferase